MTYCLTGASHGRDKKTCSRGRRIIQHGWGSRRSGRSGFCVDKRTAHQRLTYIFILDRCTKLTCVAFVAVLSWLALRRAPGYKPARVMLLPLDINRQAFANWGQTAAIPALFRISLFPSPRDTNRIGQTRLLLVKSKIQMHTKALPSLETKIFRNACQKPKLHPQRRSSSSPLKHGGLLRAQGDENALPPTLVVALG